MWFDLFLLLLFVGGAGALWYVISLKIPELVAISDAVIVERLHEDSARIRIFLLQFKTFYREKQYRAWFLKFCEKIFFRIHIFLLRTDNALVALTKKIRATGDSANKGMRAAGSAIDEGIKMFSNEYWAKLREERSETREVLEEKKDAPRSPRPRRHRVHEVRVKTK